MLGQLCIIVVNAILNVNDITVLGQNVCYQADQINGTYRAGIHNFFFKVKPVFMELSNNSLLEKCLHGKTNLYVGRTTLEMGMNSAVINFNTGASCVLNVMKEYGIQDGHYTNIFCAKKGGGRIKECFRKQAK